MLVLISSLWGHDIWHPLNGNGYQFWSGIGADIQELEFPAAIVVAAITLWKLYRQIRPHLECHVEDCHRLGLYHVQGTHYRTCWQDHPVLSKHPHRHVPREIIHRAHSAAVEGAVKVKEGNE